MHKSVVGRAPIAGTIAVVLLSGCSGAPSRNILGSYFPSWMICALAGIVAGFIVRAVLRQAGLMPEIPFPFVVILSTVCAFTFAIWLLWLS